MMNEQENDILAQHGANHSQELPPVAEAQSQSIEKEHPKKDSNSDQNWRLMRDRAEAAERRSQELERMVQQNLNQNQTSQKIQLVDDEDDDSDISDDSYIEGRQYKKQLKAVKKELKETRKQFQEIAIRTATDQAEFKLKTQFSDFDSVVTKDNLEKLEMAKPSLYRSILATQDIYDRGYTAYEMIKASGMVQESPYEDQDRRLEQNRSKPRSAANISPQSSDTPLTRVGDYDRRVLTEDRKRQLMKQVEEAKRYR